MKILVVDDEPFVLKLLAHMLRRLGFGNVTGCERVADALQLMDDTGVHFDLIFCDLQMPDVDGVQFVRILVGRQYPGSLVLVSGEDERILHSVETLARAYRLDVLGVLQKPFSLDRLRQMLEGVQPVARAQAPKPDVPPPGAAELRAALDGNELVNHYQPQVCVRTGTVTGVEALVRWQHAEAGLVLPDHFIPAAEQHGLIHGLTDAVLRTALRDARQWLDAGLPLQLSVNVSMDSLDTLTFPESVARMADEAGFPVDRLTLEITESRLMQDPLAQIDILSRLRLKRTGLSIDDFGTGHSSLAQLRDIPFDELKVDRTFVHRAHASASMRTIFEGTLAMARQLRMKVVAEGVEDRADWDFVSRAGCDFAQGFFIAHPMPAAEFLPWTSRWQARWQALSGAGQGPKA